MGAEKKKYWTDGSLAQLAQSVNGEISELAGVAAAAIAEVHENMAALEQPFQVSYDGQEEMLVFSTPQPAASEKEEELEK